MEQPLRSRLTQDSSATGASTFSPSEESTSSGTVCSPDHVDGSRTPSAPVAGGRISSATCAWADAHAGAERAGSGAGGGTRTGPAAPSATRQVRTESSSCCETSVPAPGVKRRSTSAPPGTEPASRCVRVPTSHTDQTPEASPEASRAPSGEKRSAVTCARCPGGAGAGVPLRASSLTRVVETGSTRSRS